MREKRTCIYTRYTMNLKCRPPILQIFTLLTELPRL